VIAPDATVTSKAQINKVLEGSVSRCLSTAGAGKIRFEVVVGESGKDIGEQIVSLAYEQHADLIVMRARRSRITALLDPSLNRFPDRIMPVLITRSQGREWKCEPNGEAKFRELLVFMISQGHRSWHFHMRSR